MGTHIRLRIALHGLALLLMASLPFFLNLLRVQGLLLWLLLLIWPLAACFSPYLLARGGAAYLLALAPVPLFFLLPMCVLLTPAGLRMLGAYPVFYAITAAIGALVGRRHHARIVRSRGHTAVL